MGKDIYGKEKEKKYPNLGRKRKKENQEKKEKIVRKCGKIGARKRQNRNRKNKEKIKNREK